MLRRKKIHRMLAQRYIRAQRRQSAFTVLSIAAAVALMTMFFLLYAVFLRGYRAAVYADHPYHLELWGLTEQQTELLPELPQVEDVKFSQDSYSGITAHVFFSGDIGDRELWMQNTAEALGDEKLYLRSSYRWNSAMMTLDWIGDNAYFTHLRIFAILLLFILLMAAALRMVIDTAFEVSSKERERQYGVLQSVGATPQQIVKIITSEAMLLCIWGIPLGLLLGTLLAYGMYEATLTAGLRELFLTRLDAVLNIPFYVDWKMLLISAAVGVIWVGFSAYGTGMRIIRKSPMDSIVTRADSVQKIKRRSLSGRLFGIAGSIASRNARRQRKRFVITVLTLTVSITLFSLFSSAVASVEETVANFQRADTYDADFSMYLSDAADIDWTYQDGYAMIEESGLFTDLNLTTIVSMRLEDEIESEFIVEYVNENIYNKMFRGNPPVSYEELVQSGGYVVNRSASDYDRFAEYLNGDSVAVRTMRFKYTNAEMNELMRTLGDDFDYEITLDLYPVRLQLAGTGTAVMLNLKDNAVHGVLIAPIETYEKVRRQYFGKMENGAQCYFSLAGRSEFSRAQYDKAWEWFSANMGTVIYLHDDTYGDRLQLHALTSALRAGVLFVDLLIAVIALINLTNIISTGIANRRTELASLQCVGMTGGQLRGMAIIECLQFTLTAAAISALISAAVLWGGEQAAAFLIAHTMGGERAELRKTVAELVHVEYLKPFVRILFSSLAAFAAGCAASLVMIKRQNRDTLSEQIRGTEMHIDTQKTHIVRNSISAAAGVLLIAVCALRIYSISAINRDREAFAAAGYLQLVDAGDIQMNLHITGAEHGQHTIVGLADTGEQSFALRAEPLNALLGAENTLVYPDRAGSGFSEDSMLAQTVSHVVENYRAGLQRAGLSAPYVLMAHGYAGSYATYWQLIYPDEVEAVIYLDADTLPKNAHWRVYESEQPERRAVLKKLALRTWLGLDRAAAETGVPKGAALLSPETLTLLRLVQRGGVWDAAGERSGSFACASERLLKRQEDAALAVLLHPTDIPKLWLDAAYTGEDDVRRGYEYERADFEAAGQRFYIDPEMAAKAEWRRSALGTRLEAELRQAFSEQLGACSYAALPGDHDIFYAQKPQETAAAILNFLEK